MVTDKIRCPLCPRAMLREDYIQHFELFHACGVAGGPRAAYREPLELPKYKPRDSKLNDDKPLWEDL